MKAIHKLIFLLLCLVYTSQQQAVNLPSVAIGCFIGLRIGFVLKDSIQAAKQHMNMLQDDLNTINKAHNELHKLITHNADRMPYIVRTLHTCRTFEEQTGMDRIQQALKKQNIKLANEFLDQLLHFYHQLHSALVSIKKIKTLPAAREIFPKPEQFSNDSNNTTCFCCNPYMQDRKIIQKHLRDVYNSIKNCTTFVGPCANDIVALFNTLYDEYDSVPLEFYETMYLVLEEALFNHMRWLITQSNGKLHYCDIPYFPSNDLNQQMLKKLHPVKMQLEHSLCNKSFLFFKSCATSFIRKMIPFGTALALCAAGYSILHHYGLLNRFS